MKGYKGFYPDLICEPDSEHKKQYAENTVYKEKKQNAVKAVCTSANTRLMFSAIIRP